MTTHIGGHEGIGHVVALGPGSSENLLSKRVGVKWLHTYCNACEICALDETACPHQHNSGRDVPGTFQQYTIHPVEGLTLIPEDLRSESAAPLLCAGLSMYGSISRAGLKAGEWLVLPGAGGGLGHLGVQIAREMGYKVIAVDTGERKRELCLQLGAAAFLDFKTDDVEMKVKELTNGYGAHAVVCLGGAAAYKQAWGCLRNCGTLVCVGLVPDKGVMPSPFELLQHGWRVVGSSVGTGKHLDALLRMAEEGKVRASVEVREFEELDDVLERLGRYEVEGRVVVRIPE